MFEPFDPDRLYPPDDTGMNVYNPEGKRVVDVDDLLSETEDTPCTKSSDATKDEPKR